MKAGIKRDPATFIELTTQALQEKGYTEQVHYIVRVSPYTNRIHHFFKYVVNCFLRKPKEHIDLYDLKRVQRYHDEGYCLEFNSKELKSMEVEAIYLSFNKSNNSCSIGVLNKTVEVWVSQQNEENTNETQQLADNLSETLLCNVLMRLYS